jgi:hypothetical protein
MTRPRQLARPRPADVPLGTDGMPARIGRTPVESVLEDWLVEDRWWSERPIRRRYLELATRDGACVVVFRDLIGGGWFIQRA